MTNCEFNNMEIPSEYEKNSLSDVISSIPETATEIYEKVEEGIKDFLHNTYEDIKEWLNPAESLVSETSETMKLGEGITEGREFGLAECTEAALELFTPEIIASWSTMSNEQRAEIAEAYSERVAEAFGINYEGMFIEAMKPGVLGSNNGDGTIHLSEGLLSSKNTPFLLIDTITHELRHQYQSECINGLHDVSDEIRNEWAMATLIYNYDDPTSFDPWGYKYNPLEIDSNYAGNTVVRNVTSQMFNDIINA